MEWEPVSDRPIRARFASYYCNLAIWKKEKRQAKNHLAEERKSWKRWVLHGAKRRPKHGTGLYGEVLLRPYVPDRTKRISE